MCIRDRLNPKVGAQIDIAKDMQPQLFRYEKDTKKLSPVTGDNYKIIIYRGTDEETGEPDNDYDTEGWELSLIHISLRVR